jgi:hypothetical protein
MDIDMGDIALMGVVGGNQNGFTGLSGQTGFGEGRDLLSDPDLGGVDPN